MTCETLERLFPLYLTRLPERVPEPLILQAPAARGELLSGRSCGRALPLPFLLYSAASDLMFLVTLAPQWAKSVTLTTIMCAPLLLGGGDQSYQCGRVTQRVTGNA